MFGTPGLLLRRPWWSSAWGQISMHILSVGAAELALWPHVQFIKLVCIFHRTQFPGLFGLNTVSSPGLPRERLSTDHSALHILCVPVKFGTGLLLLLRDQILEFYFINILSPRGGFFFWGEGRSGLTLFSPGLSAFPAGMQSWPLSLTFNPTCHVGSCLQYPEGWSCAVHRNKSVTVGRGHMFIITVNLQPLHQALHFLRTLIL